MATAIQDIVSATSSKTTGPLAATSATQIQDRFLTLLVTQLKNQDPLSPMDNAQITTQLSQISTVSGIDKLNTTMADLATAMTAAMTASQSMNNVSMIGRQVMAPSNALALTDKGATGAVELADNADSVKVRILGPAGNILRSIDLGATAAGLKNFTWDGKSDDGRTADNGKYTMQVEASLGGKPVEAKSYLVGNVTAVGIAGADSTLVVDGTSDVRFADVKRIQ